MRAITNSMKDPDDEGNKVYEAFAVIEEIR